MEDTMTDSNIANESNGKLINKKDIYNGIFATYRTGENRVTASIIAVLGSLSIKHTNRLIFRLMQREEFKLIKFENQISKDGNTVPDAEISSSNQILIETKTSLNKVNREQILGHIKVLDDNKLKFVHQYLLILTPDSQEPTLVESIGDPRIVWASFSKLNEVIDDLLKDKKEIVSEREAFLLRELQIMFESDDLLGFAKDTVIVAARSAWEEYKKLGIYICQADRFFQSVEYIGFYTGGEIQPKIAKIIGKIFRGKIKDSNLTKEQVAQILSTSNWKEDDEASIFMLSPFNDELTIDLKHSIKNDLISDDGKKIAFTQGQRYVCLNKLKEKKTTSDLIKKDDQP